MTSPTPITLPAIYEVASANYIEMVTGPDYLTDPNSGVTDIYEAAHEAGLDAVMIFGHTEWAEDCAFRFRSTLMPFAKPGAHGHTLLDHETDPAYEYAPIATEMPLGFLPIEEPSPRPYYQFVGDVLRRMRQTKRIHIATIAPMVGLSITEYSAIERNRGPIPAQSVLDKIANVLGFSQFDRAVLSIWTDHARKDDQHG